MVRGKNRPLVQIGNRMTELFLITNSMLSSHLNKSTQYPKCSQSHSNGPLPLNCINPQYKTLDFEKFKIKIDSPNNIYGTKSGDIIVVENICYSQRSSLFRCIG